MKTLSAILLSLLLMCSACALALSGAGYPAYDGADLPNDAFGARFGDERLLLRFDPAPEYSNRMEGTLQLSFYAYDASETFCLELYLLLPEQLQTNDAGELDFAELYLYEGNGQEETLYFAAMESGATQPAESNLHIHLEQVEVRADAISASGTLEAGLIAYQNDLPTGEILTLTDARFSFTLPLNAGAQLPEASAKPASPAFTLPPDYAKV